MRIISKLLSRVPFVLPSLFLVLFLDTMMVEPVPTLMSFLGFGTGTSIVDLFQIGWQSWGTPDRPIVSLDSNWDTIYASTDDKRIFARYLSKELAPKGWFELKNSIPFEQPPLLALVCGSRWLAADGENLYSREYDDWKIINNPIHGSIRQLATINKNGDVLIFIVGENQIDYSRGCDFHWEELWNNQPISSNLAASSEAILVASNGKLMARFFEQRYTNANLEWTDWRDVSNNISGKLVYFVAFGANRWGLAATDNEVYRSSLRPYGNWQPFNNGLPIGSRVQGITGARFTENADKMLGNIALFTDKGAFLFSDGSQWEKINGFASPLAYIQMSEKTMETSRRMTLVASDHGVWTQSVGFSGMMDLITGSLLLILVFTLPLFTLAIFDGLGRINKRRSRNAQGVS
jgi:hypothetical protein